MDQITRKNRSLQNFQAWQFTSLSLRKQQCNGLNGSNNNIININYKIDFQRAGVTCTTHMSPLVISTLESLHYFFLEF